MKNYVFLSLFVFFAHSLSAQNNFENIYAALKSGNSKELSKYFDNQIELTIKGASVNAQNTYSKTQATSIMKEFFSQVKPVSFKELHGGAANEWLKYKIGYLTTEKGKFRLMLRVKETKGSILIQEIELIKE